ncbi:MAG: DUF5947 family protein [Burkholderiaceae bacterium]
MSAIPSRTESRVAGWVAEVRRFVREDDPLQHCELCSAQIADSHQHLIEVRERRLVCCCQACALLFGHNDAAKYRTIPQRREHLSDFTISDAQWDALAIPINVAFFVKSSARSGVVALYPSPAGATESQLDLEAWKELETVNPVLGQMEPDTEALLVNRVENAREYYRVSIDHCYQLVGLIRAGWRGISGGAQVWEAIRQFFDALKSGRSREGHFHA